MKAGVKRKSKLSGEVKNMTKTSIFWYASKSIFGTPWRPQELQEVENEQKNLPDTKKITNIKIWILPKMSQNVSQNTKELIIFRNFSDNAAKLRSPPGAQVSQNDS